MGTIAQITATGNYTISESDNPIVRVNSTTLYIMLTNAVSVYAGSVIELWKSTDNGVNWSFVLGSTPATGVDRAPAIAIGHDGIMRIVYVNYIAAAFPAPAVATLKFFKVNPASDTTVIDLQTAQTIGTNIESFYTGIAASPNYYHVVYMDNTANRGVFSDKAAYTVLSEGEPA